MSLSGTNISVALVAAAASGLVDRLSKSHVIHDLRLAPGDAVEVWPGIVTFVMSWNRGINFGLFASHADAVRFGLAGFAALVSIAMLVWAARHRRDRLFATGVGLVIGGALGNAYDRVSYGAVADFLNVTCCGIRNPFAFNIADVAIFLGVALVFWRSSEGGAPAEGQS